MRHTTNFLTDTVPIKLVEISRHLEHIIQFLHRTLAWFGMIFLKLRDNFFLFKEKNPPDIISK